MKRKLGQYSRGVSIIGVGCTPFMNILKNPETEGLTESEMFAYAAIDAMKDAGIHPHDIQGYFHGQAGAICSSDQNSANVHVNDWFGCKGLGSYAHSQACCTGYLALDLAAQAVASGKWDFVLSGCVDVGACNFVPDMPACYHEKLTTPVFQKNVERTYDRAYTRQFEAGQSAQQDDFVNWYMKQYGLTFEQVDDGINGFAINNRHNAAGNERALFRTEFADLAKAAGCKDVWEYMRSDEHNPFVSRFLRRTGMEARADGAAACIVCPTEMAYEFTDHPIEVLGFGNSVIEAMTPHLEVYATRESVRQVYELTGLTGDDLDLLMANDFFMSSNLLAAEEAGYIPRGKAWEYARDGRTAFDGDKPMNVNGGRCSFGHAHAASGMADIFEVVRQMRGEAGERQLQKRPEIAMVRGFGGSQNLCAGILKIAQ